MTELDRPLRADAARNRAQVLQIAYDAFAEQGLAVPIDEIARRAGVGPGTVYRHFSTKEALFQAVIGERVRQIVAGGHALLAADPATALFEFLHEMVRSSAADHGMVDALAGYGIDVDLAAPGAEAEFLAVLGELLSAAQKAGAVRADLGWPSSKRCCWSARAAEQYGDGVADRIVEVVVDGLRAR